MKICMLPETPVPLGDCRTTAQNNGRGVQSAPTRDACGIFHYLDRSTSEEALVSGTNIATANTYGDLNEAVVCDVRDVTGKESHFTLEKHGFKYRTCPTALRVCDWEDQDKVKAVYYTETAEIIKQVTGASHVHVFSHLTRVSHGTDSNPPAGAIQGRQQVYKVHVDQVPSQVEKNIRFRLPAEEADRILNKHFQIINVWRPIETIYRDPLAIADLSSVSSDDLVNMNFALPNGRHASNVAVKANSTHRWFYKYAQAPNEVVIFKQYDNGDGVACYGQVPHSSFIDEAGQRDTPRRSIEIRAFVSYN
ncbi:hypothetical protein DL95DRAFT_512227 [Leptodontidium sp. 2 PMI_412]|nr:hypothetical protein DL95DRAFT_512227 [Leptodontidium sp. 2 PMI_412]